MVPVLISILLFMAPVIADHGVTTEADCATIYPNEASLCIEHIRVDQEYDACASRVASSAVQQCRDEITPASDGYIGVNSAPGGSGTTTETIDFSPQGGSLETDTGEPIDQNPIYLRLNEIIGILSVGVGIVITASVVYAGIQYTTSRGDPNKTQAAVKRIIQAGIALALYIFGWTILNWLIPGGVFG